jgi:autotransporter-associated beta strand protein
MTFDGSTTMMESGVHNGLVRTLSAWIDPYASGDAGGYYQPILDSNDELNAGMYGSGFGLDNGLIKVRLDGLGMWNTGVPVQLNTWQQITLTFNGSIAKLYVNDILKASTAYTADPNNLAGKNYRIGWGQSGSDTSTRTFFDGQILDLQIYDRVTPIADPNVYCWDTQTTAGHQGGNGTWDSTGTNVDWSDGDGTTLTAWPAGSTDKTAAFATDSGNASWNISVTGNPTPLAIDFGDENGYSTDPYTLSGGTLGVGTGGITAYYSGAISAPVTLRGAQTWDAETGATLTVGGNINTSGYSLAFSGNGTTYVSGNISGNGSLTQQGGGATYLAGTVTTTGGVVQNGTGSLTLLGSGSALGPVSINQGTLVVGNGTTTTTSATSTSTAIGNGTTLDVKSGTYTMPGVSVGHDSQVGFIMLEGAGTLTSTAAITMGFNQGSASLVAQNNSVLNGGTNTLDMGTANASSVYVDLKNNARATFGNVNVASSNYYHDGQGSYAVLEVDDNASLSVSSTLTVGGYAGNTTLPAKLNGQLYQSGGTVAAKYVILGNDTADASDTLVGVYNLCGGTLQTAQISQGTRSASDYPGVAYFNFHGGTLAYNGTTSQSDFISLRANLASTVDIYEGATINSGTQSVTVSQPLLAPTGNGVASIDISGLSNPNQTYVVPPWVYISGGGGSGATAVATLDPVTHTVNGILVTNPGSGYTSTPTVQLIRTYDAIQTASAAKITMRANSVYSGGLTKIGAGSLSLTAASTYTGPTTIDAGTLFVSNTTGSGTGTDSVIVNSTLGGTGAIAGPVTVNASGSLAPGINGIGTLTVNNTLALSGTTVMEINKTTGTCDKIAGISTVTFGGTLTVMKLAGTLAAGDSFTLFSAAAYAGNFTTLNLPALAAGLRWDTSTLKTNGSIKVVVDAYPTVASPAACTLALDGKTAQLTVLGADDGGEPNLKYTWTVTSVPSGALSPTFSANGTNVAKNATVTFYQACTYNFTVAIADQLSQTVTSATSINVIQMPVTLAIGPSGAGLFSTTGTDQFGKPLTPATPFAWPTIGITAQRSGNSLHLYQTGTSDDLIPSYLAADLANLTFTGADDVAATLTIDESDGDLLMQTGGTVAFSGGAQDADAGNVLLLVGTSGDDNAVIGAAQIALNGWTPVAYANVRYFGFDLSGGTNSLLIDHATLNLNQDNAISAGTNVTIDGGILDLNTKTDTIGNLTLKSGSIVNGTIYANAYKIESGTVTAAITGPGDLQKTTTGLATTGVVNTSNVSVEAGQLTATSISTGTLTIGAGSIVTITPIPGGPLAANSTLTPLATRALRPTLRKPIAESTTAYTTIAPSSSTATITIAAEPLAASSTVLATPVPVSIEVASVLASSNSSSKTVLDVAAAPTAIVADIATQVSLTDSTSTILIGTAINRHRLQSPVYSWIDSTALNKIIEGGLQQSLTTSDGNITSKSILDSLSDELLSHVSKFAKHSTIPTINIRSAHLAALQTYSRWSYLDTEADFDIGRHVRAGKHSNQFEKAIDKVLAEEEDAIPALL